MAHGRFWRQSVQGVCHILWYLLQKLGVWWCVVVTSWASAKDPRFSALTLGILPDRLEVSAGSSNWALIQAEGSCPRERLLELGGDRRTNGFAENITNSTTPMDDSNWVHVYFPSDVRGKSAPLPAVGRRWGLIAPPGSRTAKTSQTSETSGSLNDDQTSGSRIGGAERVAAAEENLLSIGKESQKLQLTVRVRLNPDDFSLDDERYRAELQTHTMEPVLTISFHKNEEGEKFFKTTLSLTYCLDANVKELGDPTRFGWFHDNLTNVFQVLGGNCSIYRKIQAFAIIPQGGCVEIACLAHHIDDLDVMDPSAKHQHFQQW
ncbi:hypothetical protein R1sor_011403 [Riccia sorocarpa]|uniref:Uncharacterized protein n=1 Tax=Riccia sorocarpa TaxID=122646 RepID=A0ABD3I3I4_9MARC